MARGIDAEHVDVVVNLNLPVEKVTRWAWIRVGNKEAMFLSFSPPNFINHLLVQMHPLVGGTHFVGPESLGGVELSSF